MKNPALVELIANKTGVVIVFIALALFAILGLVALALDVGFMYGVKGQLQSAADASALAGAGSLYPVNSSTPPPTFPSPNFVKAEASAKAFAKENKVAGAYLADTNIVSIESGYWNLEQDPLGLQALTTPTGKCSVSGAPSASGAPCTSSAGCPASETCLIQDVPAIQVKVRKPVPTFFAKLLGWDQFTPEATATAAIGYPQSGKGIFPVAVTKCMVENYFSQDPMPNPPTQVRIGGPYGSVVPGCSSGQWTSLTTGRNDVPTMKELMDGSLEHIKIGELIWIDPGAKDALFQYLEAKFIGRTVELPMVGDVALSTNTQTPITGFVYFKIEGTDNASKEIIGHFVHYYKDEHSTRLGGAKYNGVTQPILVE